MVKIFHVCDERQQYIDDDVVSGILSEDVFVKAEKGDEIVF